MKSNPMKDAALMESAIELVVTRMRGKRRNGGDKPMVIHSINVGNSLDRAGMPITVIVAGYLHDLVEDANVTLAQIKTDFGERIARLVDACTHDMELHQTDSAAANDALFAKAEACGKEAIAIKVADSADNLKTVEHLSEDRRATFMNRAARWAQLGRIHLGATHPLMAKIRRRYRNASQRLRAITLAAKRE